MTRGVFRPPHCLFETWLLGPPAPSIRHSSSRNRARLSHGVGAVKKLPIINTIDDKSSHQREGPFAAKTQGIAMINRNSSPRTQRVSKASFRNSGVQNATKSAA